MNPLKGFFLTPYYHIAATEETWAEVLIGGESRPTIGKEAVAFPAAARFEANPRMKAYGKHAIIMGTF